MMDDLDNLYLPNKWSKRLTPDKIIESHLEFINKESLIVRSQIPCELNIPYGELPKAKFDIFGTDLPETSPILVFIHGGYWQKDYLNKNAYQFISRNFYKNGIKSIIVGYELCPKVSISQIVQEIQIAIKSCIDYAKSNKSKGLFLMGYSSGAHLVASLFTDFIETLSIEDKKFIKAAILIGGIYDLRDIPKTIVNLPLQLDDSEAEKLSPLIQSISNRHEILFFVGAAENDSPIFKEQSEEFYKKLDDLGIKSEFVLIEKVDHFDMIELLAEKDYQLTKRILNVIQFEQK